MLKTTFGDLLPKIYKTKQTLHSDSTTVILISEQIKEKSKHENLEILGSRIAFTKQSHPQKKLHYTVPENVLQNSTF